MKEIIFNFFSQVGQKLAVLLLIGTTAVTTGSAVAKLVTKPPESHASDKAEVKAITKTEDQVQSETGSETNQNLTGQNGSTTLVVPTITIAPTLAPVIPTTTPTIHPSPSPAVNRMPSLTPTPKVNNPVVQDSRLGGDDDREDKQNEDRYIQEKPEQRSSTTREVESGDR